MKKLLYITLILSFTLISGNTSIAREPTPIDDDDISSKPVEPVLPQPIDYTEAPPQGFKVAFVGDTGIYPPTFQLIASEGADMVIFDGDGGYSAGPAAFNNLVHTYLEDNGAAYPFPFFFTLGNHDSGGDLFYFKQRVDALEQQEGRQICKTVQPNGSSLGFESICKYKGIMFAQGGIGFSPQTQEFLNLVDTEFTYNKSHWEFCSQHVPLCGLSITDKCTPVTGAFFNLCQRHGAPIVEAHTHAYSRSHTINQLSVAAISPNYPGVSPQYVFLNDGALDGLGPIPVDESSNFVVDSSLGGRPPRGCRSGGVCNGWAQILPQGPAPYYGVLFGIFNYPLTGDPELDKRVAVFYFKHVDSPDPNNPGQMIEGEIKDLFIVISNK